MPAPRLPDAVRGMRGSAPGNRATVATTPPKPGRAQLRNDDGLQGRLSVPALSAREKRLPARVLAPAQGGAGLMAKGDVPVYIMRFAPSDYTNDPFVKRLYLRGDYRTAAFYPAFLFHSHQQGGDLPADPDDLAAVVLMRRRDVEASLKVCMEAG